VNLINNVSQQQAQASQEVLDSEQGLEQPSKVITDTSQIINSLAADCLAAMDILGEVNNIAEQTNLLALNAAIEAARAGEQGRGTQTLLSEATQVEQIASQSRNASNNMVQRFNDLANEFNALNRNLELIKVKKMN